MVDHALYFNYLYLLIKIVNCLYMHCKINWHGLCFKLVLNY